MRRQGLILIIDNATIHRSRETRLFLERHREINPFYLPKYSPSLNEVEGRIMMLKKNICTNHTYQSIEGLEDAARQYLRKHNKGHKYLDLT